MARLFDDESSRDFFSEKYSRIQSAAALRIEEAVLGHASGLSGYTTVEQARLLRERIELSPESRTLDLGAGRGWPGAYLARETGCPLVFCDTPFECLHEALLQSGCDTDTSLSAVVADGRALPFRAETFDAIVFADVF
ncbi:MAG: class I SAM-dependent methyltransferase [Acidobacteria bacterium]|nr:class I SAM-dependent methyltransferase [Acidobacteriota bacterium]